MINILPYLAKVNHFFEVSISTNNSFEFSHPYFTPLRHFDLWLSDPSILKLSPNHSHLFIFQVTLIPVSPWSSPCKQSHMNLYPAKTVLLIWFPNSCSFRCLFLSPLLKRTIYLTNLKAKRDSKLMKGLI